MTLRFLTSFPCCGCRDHSAPNTYRGSAAGSDRGPGPEPAVGAGGHALPRPRNTFVPSYRPIQDWCWLTSRRAARFPLSPGSGEGQRPGKPLWASRFVRRTRQSWPAAKSIPSRPLLPGYAPARGSTESRGGLNEYQLAVIDLWYRSGGGRLCSSATSQRCLVQLSAQPLGG